MRPFLKIVADDIFTRFNGNFEGTAIVFPNKRAALFFNEYLLERIGDNAIWSPAYLTISELFEYFSDWVVGDPVLLVSKLHKEYCRHTGSNDTLDNFYYWGEMLIKDFDDIDKNLADAKLLFSNIKDLRELGTVKDTLEEEQKKAIKHFFCNFKEDDNSDIKKKFRNLWEVLYPIYCSFKENLQADNLAYEGMLYRDIIENEKSIDFPYDKYIFVGFNALNMVEYKLFDTLQKEGRAIFYWDYDKFYTDNENNEAGHFMRKNLKRFPNALDKALFENLSTEKEITFVSANTDSLQTRYIPLWLKNNLSEREIETAIVLCDETMLEATLHSLPDKIGNKPLEHLNVTMGFPILHTPVYTLVKQLIDLHTRGYNKKQERFALSYVETILKHPYIVGSSDEAYNLREYLLTERRFFPSCEELYRDDILTLLFTYTDSNEEWIKNIAKLIYTIANARTTAGEISGDLYEELFCEALLKAHCQAQRLLALLQKGEIDMRRSAIGSLFLRMLSGLSMPFHGEPIVGLQVMGLLETRNLDFKNIIILAANEGNLPKSSNDNSFIPYNLRRAFGLTMSEHRDSIYAYYFYRLLQRAEKITVVYNNSTDSKTKGECSRYLLQLLGSNLYKIKKVRLETEQSNSYTKTEPQQKTPEIMQKLYKLFDTNTSDTAFTLSPSGINRYLDCGMKFFYYYIMELKKLQEVETELKANDFGNIFHLAADLMYKKIMERGNGTIDAQDLDYYTKNPQELYNIVNEAFIELFFKKDKKAILNGEQIINRDVLCRLLMRLVKIDKQYAPFKYIGGEKKIYFPFVIKDKSKREIKINIGGTIDRIDAKGDTLNIVDYKTGGDDKDLKTTLEEIFKHQGNSSGYRFQIFLYTIAIIELLSMDKDFSKDNNMSWIEDVKHLNVSRFVPSLLYIHRKANATREHFIVDMNKNPIGNVVDFKNDFLNLLQQTLQEIFDKDTPFTCTDEKERCTYCEYKEICCR